MNVRVYWGWHYYVKSQFRGVFMDIPICLNKYCVYVYVFIIIIVSSCLLHDIVCYAGRCACFCKKIFPVPCKVSSSHLKVLKCHLS